MARIIKTPRAYDMERAVRARPRYATPSWCHECHCAVGGSRWEWLTHVATPEHAAKVSAKGT